MPACLVMGWAWSGPGSFDSTTGNDPAVLQNLSPRIKDSVQGNMVEGPNVEPNGEGRTGKSKSKEPIEEVFFYGKNDSKRRKQAKEN